jgi:ribonuclease P/MRP protein subunit POP5
MKPYPAVMKEKRRHLTFRIVSESSHDSASINKALRKAIKSLLGDLGLAETGFLVERFDQKTQIGILRCNNLYTGKIRAALALLHEVNNKKAYVHIIRVTGTIKKAGRVLSIS